MANLRTTETFRHQGRRRRHRTLEDAQLNIMDRYRRLRRIEQAASQEIGRFAMREYLAAVYRAYRNWNRKGQLKEAFQVIADRNNLLFNPKAHPLRTIIDLTTQDPDLKKRSRWARALELAAHHNLTTAQMLKRLAQPGGLAGCARRAAIVRPKRTMPLRRSRWD